MTTISFQLAETFKTSPYTAYLPEIKKMYAGKFPIWDRIEFHINELTPLELGMSVKDRFDYTEWGCRVTLKVSTNQEDFFSRIKTSLEYLAERHTRQK